MEQELNYHMSSIPKKEQEKKDYVLFKMHKFAQAIANKFYYEENINIDSKDISDVAEGKHYYLSSNYVNYPKKGLVEEKKPFFFHTGFGLNQYITIDLEKEHILTSLLVVNRVDGCRERSRCLFYAAHKTLEPNLSFGCFPLNISEFFWNQDCLECHTDLKKIKARYITIFSPENTALHFSDIKVYGTPVKPDTSELNNSPPKSIPAGLWSDFTLGNKIPVINAYYNETRKIPIHLSMKAYNKAFEELDKGSLKYYGKTLDYLLNTFHKYSVANKSVLVFGLAGVNCDAISIWKGAKDVYVIDYNLPISEHPQVQVFSHEDYTSHNIQADVGISISSFEHDGLGRYGDPINPVGDLEAMKLSKKLIKKGGLLFFSVPIGKDCIVWNAHRIYGKIRLPMMFEGWEVLETFGHSDSLMIDRPLGCFEQPVFVLKNL